MVFQPSLSLSPARARHAAVSASLSLGWSIFLLPQDIVNLVLHLRSRVARGKTDTERNDSGGFRRKTRFSFLRIQDVEQQEPTFLVSLDSLGSETPNLS